MTEAVRNEIRNNIQVPLTPELTVPRFCEDGGICIADFQGFKAEGECDESCTLANDGYSFTITHWIPYSAPEEG